MSSRNATDPKAFREGCWNPACRAAGIEADVHQARHWYVTQAIRSIYETSQSQAEIDRRLRELIEYMGWKSGWETIQAYQHYFDPQRHAEIQDQLHQRLDAALKEDLDRGLVAGARAVPAPTPSATKVKRRSNDVANAIPISNTCSLLEEDVASLATESKAWRRLRGRIAGEVFMAPRTCGDPHNQGHWPEVPHRVVNYLERNVLSSPWANAGALLAAIMMARRFEVSSVIGKIVILHSRFTSFFACLGLARMEDWDALCTSRCT